MWHPRVAVLTSADFKAGVQNFVERPENARRMPSSGETLIVGATAGGTWTSLRVRRRMFAPMMVGGLIRLKKLDRVAVVIAGGAPRQFLVGFADRESVKDDAGISDRRLARLVAAAINEWSSTRKPMRTIFGRPWPIMLLVLALLLEFGSYVTRFARHTLQPDLANVAVLVLIGATAVLVARQSRLGYGLALALSVIQVARFTAFYAQFVDVSGLGLVAYWLLLSWSEPALIWVLLGIVYLDRRRRLQLQRANSAPLDPTARP